MKRVLIHEISVSGHRLEYIHHLYTQAAKHSDTEFIFALPDDFERVRDRMEWPEANNIELFLYAKQELSGHPYKQSYSRSKILKQQIADFKVDFVFLPSFIEFFPALPAVITRGVKISGIIYTIPLYHWEEASAVARLRESLYYWIFAKSRVFQDIFMLNDAVSARYLNAKLKTDKFKHLPDPFVPLDKRDITDIRSELGIAPAKKIFIHFGGLGRDKGTLNILDAILLMQEEDLKRAAFVFAGVVYDDIKKEFYEKLKLIEDKVQVQVFDQFCTYSFLGSLCYSTDYILIPYKRTSNSSGLIGYAAQFGKPVIAPDERLLGKLIRQFELGITIADTRPKTIAQVLSQQINSDVDYVVSSEYLKLNTVDSFAEAIFHFL